MASMLSIGVITGVVLASTCCRADTIHAVLVGDTGDGTIGLGVSANLHRMGALVDTFRTWDEIDVNVVEVKDDAFNCAGINSAVDNLVVGKNDVVLFYYSGHGFRRNSAQTQFPEFDCQGPNAERAELAKIVSRLLETSDPAESPPRLVLAMADTCNTKIDPEPPVAAQAEIGERWLGLRRLFLHYAGTVVMSGSEPGFESWYLSTGGFFTNQFLQSLSESGERSDVRWEDIIAASTRDIFVPTQPPTVQKPQAAVNVSLLTIQAKPASASIPFRPSPKPITNGGTDEDGLNK